jgi:hypothetical protein
MAAGSAAVARKVAALGMAMLQPAHGLATLERLLCAPALPSRAAALAAGPAALPAVAPAVPFRWGAFFRAGSDEPVKEAFSLIRSAYERRRGEAAQRASGRAGYAAAVLGVATTAPGLSAKEALAQVQEVVAGVLGRQVSAGVEGSVS